MKRSNFSPKRPTYDFQIFGNETMITAGYEDMKVSIFH